MKEAADEVDARKVWLYGSGSGYCGQMLEELLLTPCNPAGPERRWVTSAHDVLVLRVTLLMVLHPRLGK